MNFVLSIFLLVTLNSSTIYLCANERLVINIRDFGAKGDGISDDYEAMISAANYLNAKGGGELFFPPGSYLIKPYHTSQNKIKDITFRNCNDLRIWGKQAKIIVNGSFKRTADYKNGRFSYSKVNAVIPMQFTNCNNVTIDGIQLYGGVKNTTRDVGVVESGGHLIRFYSCTNVTVKNTKVEYAQTDGIYINGKCSDFYFNNVSSSNNARQGLSIIQLINGRFENCLFNENGFTNGKYGGHAPAAGVDIEPGVKSMQIVRGISFFKCSFQGNAGSQFTCTHPKTTSEIQLDSCIIDKKSGKYTYQMILSAKSFRLTNSVIDLGGGNIYPLWASHNGSDVEISNCIIKGSGRGVVAVSKGNRGKLLIRDNHMIFTGEKLTSYFPYLQMDNMIFKYNKVEIPARAVKPGQITSLVQKGMESTGNIFITDNPAFKPKVSYTGTKNVKDL